MLTAIMVHLAAQSHDQESWAWLVVFQVMRMIG